MAKHTIPQPTAGERVKAKRGEAKLTQAELAAKCGIDQTHISLFESGSPIGPHRAQKLAEAFGEPDNWELYWSRANA